MWSGGRCNCLPGRTTSGTSCGTLRCRVGEALVVDNATGQADQDRGKIIRRARYVTFQMAEVAMQCELFPAILERMQRFGVPPPLMQRG